MAKKQDVFDLLNKREINIILSYFEESAFQEIENKIGNEIKIDKQNRIWITYNGLQQLMIDDVIKHKKTLSRLLNKLKHFDIMKNMPQSKSKDNRSWWSVNLDWIELIKSSSIIDKVQDIRFNRPERFLSYRNCILFDVPGNVETEVINLNKIDKRCQILLNEVNNQIIEWAKVEVFGIWSDMEQSNKFDFVQKFIIRQYIPKVLRDVLKYSKFDKKNNKIPSDIDDEILNYLILNCQEQIKSLNNEISEKIDIIKSKLTLKLKKESNKDDINGLKGYIALLEAIFYISNLKDKKFQDYNNIFSVYNFNKQNLKWFHDIFQIKILIDKIINELFKRPIILIRSNPRSIIYINYENILH